MEINNVLQEKEYAVQGLSEKYQVFERVYWKILMCIKNDSECPINRES